MERIDELDYSALFVKYMCGQSCITLTFKSYWALLPFRASWAWYPFGWKRETYKTLLKRILTSSVTHLYV